MNIFKEIAEAISDANSYTATNVTAVKVNVEWAREALKEMEQLADEVYERYMAENGNIRRCWQCCMDGLEGESKEVMREAVEKCREEYNQISESLQHQATRNSQYLEAFVEKDQALAEAFRNA